MKCNRLLLLLAAEAVLCAPLDFLPPARRSLPCPALLPFRSDRYGAAGPLPFRRGRQRRRHRSLHPLLFLASDPPSDFWVGPEASRRGRAALPALRRSLPRPLSSHQSGNDERPGPSLYGGALIGGVLYSILLAWAVLRILRYFSLADLPRFHRCVSILLAALSIYFVYAIFGAGLSDLLKGFQDLSASNQGSEWFGVDLTLTQGFLVLNFLLSVLPYVLNLFLVFSARQLLSALRGIATPRSQRQGRSGSPLSAAGHFPSLSSASPPETSFSLPFPILFWSSGAL